MTFEELIKREKCTDEEIEILSAYYLALKIMPLLPVIIAFYQTSKLFPKQQLNNLP